MEVEAEREREREMWGRRGGKERERGRVRERHITKDGIIFAITDSNSPRLLWRRQMEIWPQPKCLSSNTYGAPRP